MGRRPIALKRRTSSAVSRGFPQRPTMRQSNTACAKDRTHRLPSAQAPFDTRWLARQGAREEAGNLMTKLYTDMPGIMTLKNTTSNTIATRNKIDDLGKYPFISNL